MRLKPFVFALPGVIAASLALPVTAAAQSSVNGQSSDPLLLTGKADHQDDKGIDLGGSISFDYTNFESFNKPKKPKQNRYGDLTFNHLSLNADGSIGKLDMSAQWRWYQGKNVLHHAWIGYLFTKRDHGKVGLVPVPFGDASLSDGDAGTPLAYLGLENGYEAGMLYEHADDAFNIQMAFLKNDGAGGITGDGVNNNATYNITAWSKGVKSTNSDSAGAAPSPIEAAKVAQTNTVAGKVSYTLKPVADTSVELGVSALSGGLQGEQKRVGTYNAQALYVSTNYSGWKLGLQGARYNYKIDGVKGGFLLHMSAKGHTYPAPNKAVTWTGNLAYTFPVSWGPVTAVTLFNDYSLMNNKLPPEKKDKKQNPLKLANTWTDYLGASLKSGPVVVGINYYTGINTPDVDGSLVGAAKKRDHGFDLSLTYSF